MASSARTERKPRLARSAAWALALALGACTTVKPYEPKVDLAGKSEAQYRNDLLLCRENAHEMDVLKGAVIGGAAGTAIGAITGGILGEPGTGTLIGLTGGAIGGATGSSAYSEARRQLEHRDPHEGFVRDCLQQHGYTLLDAPPAAASGPAEGGRAESATPESATPESGAARSGPAKP